MSRVRANQRKFRGKKFNRILELSPKYNATIANVARRVRQRGYNARAVRYADGDIGLFVGAVPSMTPYGKAQFRVPQFGFTPPPFPLGHTARFRRDPTASMFQPERGRRSTQSYNYIRIPWRDFQDPIIGLDTVKLQNWLSQQQGYNPNLSFGENLSTLGGADAIQNLQRLQGGDLFQTQLRDDALSVVDRSEDLMLGMNLAMEDFMQARIDEGTANIGSIEEFNERNRQEAEAQRVKVQTDFDLDFDLDDLLGDIETADDTFNELFDDKIDEMWQKGFEEWGDNPEETKSIILNSQERFREEARIGKSAQPSDLEDLLDSIDFGESDSVVASAFYDSFDAQMLTAPDGTILAPPTNYQGGLGSSAPASTIPQKRGIWTWRPVNDAEGFETEVEEGWAVLDSAGEAHSIIPYDPDDPTDKWDSILTAYEDAQYLSSNPIYSMEGYSANNKPAPGIAVVGVLATADKSSGTYLGFEIKGLGANARLEDGDYKFFLDGTKREPEDRNYSTEIMPFVNRFMLPQWVSGNDRNRDQFEFLDIDGSVAEQAANHRRLVAAEKVRNQGGDAQAQLDATEGAKYQIRLTDLNGNTTSLFYQSTKGSALREAKQMLRPGASYDELFEKYSSYDLLMPAIQSGKELKFDDYTIEVWRAPSLDGVSPNPTLANRVGQIFQQPSGELQFLEDL